MTCRPCNGGGPSPPLLSPPRVCVSLMDSGMSSPGVSLAGEKSSPTREAGVAGLTVDRLVLRPV